MVKVNEIMSKKVVTFQKSNGIHALSKLMSKDRISCVVITEKDLVIGVVTERDLIRKIVLPNKDVRRMRVEQVMTKNVISIEPEKTLGEASQVMKNKGIRHLPVIKDGRLEGIITETDIAKETGVIEQRNESFMTYQNIQSTIIILFFVFFGVYILYQLAIG